jgi:hypothetical protein
VFVNRLTLFNGVSSDFPRLIAAMSNGNKQASEVWTKFTALFTAENSTSLTSLLAGRWPNALNMYPGSNEQLDRYWAWSTHLVAIVVLISSFAAATKT